MQSNSRPNRRPNRIVPVASLVSLASLFAAGIVDGGGPDSAAATQSWNFDQDDGGKLPAHWTAAETNGKGTPGQWQVVRDDGAPSKPNVLKLTTANAGGTFNLCVRDDVSAADIDLSVALRADSGTLDSGGGLVWRYRDENNYYIARVNPLENNLRVYKVVDGKRVQLESADVNAEQSKWTTLRVVHVGGHIECYLDGERRLTADDDTIKESGRIGLWTKADASTSFDDLRLAPAPRKGE